MKWIVLEWPLRVTNKHTLQTHHLSLPIYVVDLRPNGGSHRPLVPHTALFAPSPHLQYNGVSLLHMATHQFYYSTRYKGVSMGMKRGNQLFMSSE